MNHSNVSLAKLIYEAAVVKKLPRSGFQILGNGEERLGEHIFMTSVIAYVLGKKIIASTSTTLRVNMEKILLMSTFHDFHEARTGDIHKMQKQYVTRDDKKANEDIFAKNFPELASLLSEYEEKKSLEAQIVYEANIISLVVVLKILVEQGDIHAKDWLANAKRVRLPESIALIDELLKTDSSIWWSDIRQKLHAEYIA